MIRILISMLVLGISSTSISQSPSTFRFHLISEPASLKPWEQKNSGSGYLLTQVTAALMTYQDHKLSGNLAQKCEFKKPKLIKCTLRKNLKWSNGKPLVAQDFVRSFQSMLSPKNKGFRADLLFPIANAFKVFKGELQPKDLKVKAPAERVLEITLESADSEFLYALANPLTAPIPATALPNVTDLRVKPNLWLSSGPYQIQEWTPQQKVVLKNNPHFWKKKNRPTLEILPITEDSVALNLYEKGELSFLRRLPALFTAKYKDRPDFYEIHQIRFDYFGFANRWNDRPVVRRSIARALPYSDLQALYFAKGAPGCPGLPENLTTEQVCVTYDPVEAQSEWSPLKDKPRKIELAYSRQGGDNHQRTAEWIQAELKKNLGLQIEVSGLENQIFLEKLEKSTPDLFRKGIAPERPTCLSALENFSTGNAENYIQFSDPRFDEILKTMRESSSEKQKQKLCTEALHLLIDPYWIIPTGPIHFTILMSPQWTGWKLNELNQLDLSELEMKPVNVAAPFDTDAKQSPPKPSSTRK